MSAIEHDEYRFSARNNNSNKLTAISYRVSNNCVNIKTDSHCLLAKSSRRGTPFFLSARQLWLSACSAIFSSSLHARCMVSPSSTAQNNYR